LLALVLPTSLSAKKPSAADFPETMIVSGGQSQSYVSGVGASRVRYRNYGLTVARIGNREYTLKGKSFLTPGTYSVRLTKKGVEAITDHDKVVKLRIVGVYAGSR
jgi:hypothetical protein